MVGKLGNEATSGYCISNIAHFEVRDIIVLEKRHEVVLKSSNAGFPSDSIESIHTYIVPVWCLHKCKHRTILAV